MLNSRTLILLTPTVPVLPAGKGAQYCRIHPTMPKAVFCAYHHHPSPNAGPEATSSWGPPQAWPHMSHPGWTAAFAWKKSSEGTRWVAHFSSHTKDRSGGSPCLLQLLRLWLLREDQGCDLSEAWNSASPGEITLSESCVFILVS